MSSVPPPPEFNPFEAPRTRIGFDPAVAGPVGEDELIRRTYLRHEASVKSVGSLLYLGAGIYGLATIVMVVSALASPPREAAGLNSSLWVAIPAMFGALLTAFLGALGYGLSNLMTWARWTMVAVTGLGDVLYIGAVLVLLATGESVPGPLIAGLAFVIAILSYILYLLLAPAGAMVFSPAYRGVIDRTPHIRQGMSLILKILLGLLAFVLLLVLAGALLRLSR